MGEISGALMLDRITIIFVGKRKSPVVGPITAAAAKKNMMTLLES